MIMCIFFFQAEDGIRDIGVTGVQTCALPILRPGRIGVLLMNLGTPEATDYWSMRRYLKEFLSDRRVIETPRLLWWPLLNGIILTTRPGREGRGYAEIWEDEKKQGQIGKAHV